MGQMGFFDPLKRDAGLDAKTDALVKLNAIVPLADFRSRLEVVWRRPLEPRKSTAGRKPRDAVVIFKSLVQQRNKPCRARLLLLRDLGYAV